MANVQVIEEGPRNLVIKVDGGGGDTLQKIVDVTALNPRCTRVRLMKVTYDVSSPAGDVAIFWEATANVPLMTFSEGSGQTMCFYKIGGIPNNAGAGVTGSVLLTSSTTTPFTLVMTFAKGGTIDSLVD